jgi:hypothetical protein
MTFDAPRQIPQTPILSLRCVERLLRKDLSYVFA